MNNPKAGPALDRITNRHPADELLEVRAEIAKLKEREEVLRAALINADPKDRKGELATARVSVSETERIDTQKLRLELGMQFLRPFTSKVQTIYVRLDKRS